MNIKRAAGCAFALFVFIFIYDWITHGMILQDAYNATAEVWRSETAMQQRFLWMTLGQLVIAIMLTLIFIHGYEGKGAAEGIRFGLLAGLLLSGPSLGLYAVLPTPLSLVGSWVVIRVIECVLAGLILSALYEP